MRIFDYDECLREAFELLEQGVEEIVLPDTGEIKPIEDYIKELKVGRAEKITNLCLYVKNTESDIEVLKKQKKVFDDRIKRMNKSLESAKSYLEIVLEGQKWKDKDGRFSVSYNPRTSVEVVKGTKLPIEYCLEPKYEPDKTKLREALESGKVIEGVSLVERQNMSVK